MLSLFYPPCFRSLSLSLSLPLFCPDRQNTRCPSLRHRLLVIAVNGNFVVIIRTARGWAGVVWVERNRVFTLSGNHSREQSRSSCHESTEFVTLPDWFPACGRFEGRGSTWAWVGLSETDLSATDKAQSLYRSRKTPMSSLTILIAYYFRLSEWPCTNAAFLSYVQHQLYGEHSIVIYLNRLLIFLFRPVLVGSAGGAARVSFWITVYALRLLR